MLIVLGVDGRVVLWVAILATLIGHFNHSNLNLTWGPLRYVLNSPRMHIWHHDAEPPPDRPHGMNFGISLSAWDWIFDTAYWPDPDAAPSQQPRRLGFDGDDRYPRTLIGRMLYPLRLPTFRRLQRGPPTLIRHTLLFNIQCPTKARSFESARCCGIPRVLQSAFSPIGEDGFHNVTPRQAQLSPEAETEVRRRS